MRKARQVVSEVCTGADGSRPEPPGRVPDEGARGAVHARWQCLCTLADSPAQAAQGLTRGGGGLLLQPPPLRGAKIGGGQRAAPSRRHHGVTTWRRALARNERDAGPGLHLPWPLPWPHPGLAEPPPPPPGPTSGGRALRWDVWPFQGNTQWAAAEVVGGARAAGQRATQNRPTPPILVELPTLTPPPNQRPPWPPRQLVSGSPQSRPP